MQDMYLFLLVLEQCSSVSLRFPPRQISLRSASVCHIEKKGFSGIHTAEIHSRRVDMKAILPQLLVIWFRDNRMEVRQISHVPQ